eukprot:NODE_590_length_1521_cov_59.614130_g434_i0.p1 GENE.NODE_590_length_1521_cov_59.614130_g434_i0~~NODE_590_length_1521_cov_59.614130_g434_i0.p1  ORF type:complete len:404 (-),score=64.28 NODE_590_length_1521_cov_59.614130_g434_i0:218-1429(-)
MSTQDKEVSTGRKADESMNQILIDKIKKNHSSTMPVIDPDGPNTGVYTIFLPWEAVNETQGLHRLLKGQKPHPSLCMLYQKGRCRAAAKCNQVHANPIVVTEVRAQGRHDCCLQHGDPPSNDQNFLFSYLLQKGDLLLITTAKKKVTIPWEKLARTACLDKLLEKKGDPAKPLRFFLSYVCRLHQNEKCRYGQDCHHIHLCREFWAGLLERHPSLSTEFDMDGDGDSQHPRVPKVRKWESTSDKVGGHKTPCTVQHVPLITSVSTTSQTALEQFAACVGASLHYDTTGFGLLGPATELQSCDWDLPPLRQQSPPTSPTLYGMDSLSKLSLSTPNICNVLIEGLGEITPVHLTGKGDETLAAVREKLSLDYPFVFVVDNDVITHNEERLIKVRKLRGVSCRRLY